MLYSYGTVCYIRVEQQCVKMLMKHQCVYILMEHECVICL